MFVMPSISRSSLAWYLLTKKVFMSILWRRDWSNLRSLISSKANNIKRIPYQQTSRLSWEKMNANSIPSPSRTLKLTCQRVLPIGLLVQYSHTSHRPPSKTFMNTFTGKRLTSFSMQLDKLGFRRSLSPYCFTYCFLYLSHSISHWTSSTPLWIL